MTKKLYKTLSNKTLSEIIGCYPKNCLGDAIKAYEAVCMEKYYEQTRKTAKTKTRIS